MKRFSKKDLEWLEFMSVPEPNTGCWLWLGYADRFGYGRARQGRKLNGAHRIAYEIHVGATIEPGLCVLHSCDNPSCVNPDHLSVGTQLENAADRTRRGRHGSLSQPGCMPRGECHWSKSAPERVARGAMLKHARLTEQDARDIRTGRVSDAQFAADLNVSEEAVRKARIGKNWKHVR